MNRRFGYISIALLAALLFFLAVGYDSWPGCIIGDNCYHGDRGKTTGGLLITAGLLVFLAAVFLIMLVAAGQGWTEIAATVVAVISAILAIAGVFYFLDKTRQWSPFIATIAMSLNVALAATLVFDAVTSSSYT